VHVARDRRHAEAIVASESPDLCFVFNWYWLFGEECLRQVPGGFLGVHMSRLPRYRGTSPVVWQLINREPEVGFSIFTLTRGMDEGDVWIQDAVPLGPDDYVSDVLSSLEAAVCRAFNTLYPKVLEGSIRPTPQPDLTPTYCAARVPDDGVIDFTWTAQRCYDFIRAQSRPYPGAFTSFLGERLVLWRANLMDVTYYGRPGQIARVESSGVTVICGDNRPLILTLVGWRGRDAIASEVIRSVRVRLPSAMAS
jgi:methionyl-tRNA formyltransferase